MDVTVERAIEVPAGKQQIRVQELVLIADVLGIPVTELFGQFSVGRPDQRGDVIDNRDGTWRMVERGSIAPGPVEQTLPVGAGDYWPHQHDGVERLYIQAGVVELVTGRERRRTRLEAREAADFEAQMVHRVVNVGDTEAVVLRSMSLDGIERHVPQSSHHL